MFARAGLSGRILRGQSADGYTNPVALHPFLARSKKKDTTKFQCYVPFVWQALVAVLVGLLVLVAGSSLCALGYRAHTESSSVSNNDTSITTHSNTTRHDRLHTMAYVGPVFMGVGCFIIVVACVVVCEQRDKNLKDIEEARKKDETLRVKKKKPKIYDAILHQLKQRKDSSVMRAKCAEETSIKSPPALSPSRKAGPSLIKDLIQSCSRTTMNSAKAEMGSISVALRRMTMDIFTVDVDGDKRTTLPPVAVDLKRPSIKVRPRLPVKFSSDPCLKASRATGLALTPPASSQPRPPEVTWPDGEKRTETDVVFMTDETQQHPETTTQTLVTYEASTHKQSTDIKHREKKPASLPEASAAHHVIVHTASVHREDDDPIMNVARILRDEDNHEGDMEVDDIFNADVSLSGVTPKLSDPDVQSSSSDDSLHLDEEMMGNFDHVPLSRDTVGETDAALYNPDISGDKTSAPMPFSKSAIISIPSQYAPAKHRTHTTRPHTSVECHGNSDRSMIHNGPAAKTTEEARPGRAFHIRTDPRATQLTVRVTTVPYSKHMSSLDSKARPHTSLPSRGRGAPVSESTNSFVSHKPRCDLHNGTRSTVFNH